MFNYYASINYAVKHKNQGFTMAQLEAYMDYLWFKYDTDQDGQLIIEETKPFYDVFIEDRPDLELTVDDHSRWF